MAVLCKRLLYLRAQFNTPGFGGATLGWIDRACHCFTGSYSTMELYRLPCASLVNVTGATESYSTDLSFWLSQALRHLPVGECFDTKVGVAA